MRGPGRAVRAARLRAGAEGLDLEGDTLWVVSEPGTRRYQQEGGRPLVPQLLAVDVSRVRPWDPPRCRV